MARYRDDTSPYVSSLFVSSPYDTSPYVTSLYISSPCDTSPYVISRRFDVPVRFIPEVCGPHSGLGKIRLNAQPIHGWRISVGCDSFRDETYGDVIRSGYDVRGCIVGERNVPGP
jgi:hypothetical protein